MFNCWITFDEVPSPSAEPNTTDWHQSKVTAELWYCSFVPETSVNIRDPGGVTGGLERQERDTSSVRLQPPFMPRLTSLLPATLSAPGGFTRPHELTDQSSSRSKSLFPQFPPVEFPTEVLPKSNLPNMLTLEKTYTLFFFFLLEMSKIIFSCFFLAV